MNTSGLNPVNKVILIKVASEPPQSSLVLTAVTKTKSQYAVEQLTGTLVAMGPDAFMDSAKCVPLGSEVRFARNCGDLFEGKDGNWYRVVEDKNIIGWYS